MKRSANKYKKHFLVIERELFDTLDKSRVVYKIPSTEKYSEQQIYVHERE